MADESEVIVQACSVITVACSLGAASLLIKKQKKALHMGEKVHNSTENVTLCCRNLLLRRWWNVSITIALVWSCRVVSKFHYTDPKTLSTTRPDPRTKSVHVEFERTGLWPDKVRRLVGDPSEPDRTLSEVSDKVRSGRSSGIWPLGNNSGRFIISKMF